MGREFGLRHQVYVALGHLAAIACCRGDLQQAESLLREALAVERQGGVDILDHLMERDRVDLRALSCAINGQSERGAPRADHCSLPSCGVIFSPDAGQRLD